MRKLGFFDICRAHGAWSSKALKLLDFVSGTVLAFIFPAKPVKTLPSSVHKILIIRPGGIGDAVFLLPIIKALLNNGISVEFFVEPRNADVFVSQGFPVYWSNRPGSLAAVFSQHYDVVIDTEQWHYLSAMAAYFIRTDCRIGFATRPLRVKLFNKAVPYGEDDYELKNFLKLFEGLISPKEIIKDTNHCFEIPIEEKQWAAAQVPQESAAIFLGASIPVRRLSKNQVEVVVGSVLKKGLTPVLLWGRDVASLAREVSRGFKDQKVINLTGKTTFNQTAALIGRCQEFIGPDTGFMHVACALGTPVTAYFGPGNLKKWQPQGALHKVITVNAGCSPCTRFGYTVPTCQGSYHCMKEGKDVVR